MLQQQCVRSEATEASSCELANLAAAKVYHTPDNKTVKRKTWQHRNSVVAEFKPSNSQAVKRRRANVRDAKPRKPHDLRGRD